MPTTVQQSSVSSAISAIRSAQNLLQQQINDADDTLMGIQLTNEYRSLDTNLTLLLHALNVTDDAIFSAAASTLKSETSGLQKNEATIKDIIEDEATATKVVGYIEQAIGFIAKL